MTVRRVAATLVVLAAALAPAASAAGDPTAEVVSNATMVMYTASGAFTNFEFVIRNCPEGSPITITWEAEQPERVDVTTGEALYFSGPDATQHFVLTTFGAFSPGYRWVGSGIVTCGAAVIPVAGSGATKIVS